MNMITKWKCWFKQNRRVKLFYKRSFAALQKQTSLKVLGEQAKAIFVMALNSNHQLGNSTDRARNCSINLVRGIYRRIFMVGP